MRFSALKDLFIGGAVSLFLAFGATPAPASPIVVDFTATNLWNGNPLAPAPPADTVTGTIIYEAASATADIQSLTSINLTINGHAYSLGEVGYISPYSAAYQIIGGTVNSITSISTATTNYNDFYLAWVKDSLVPYIFSYSSAAVGGFNSFWSTLTFSSFSVRAESFLYFPHVATTAGWQTEIAIINTGDQTVTGILRALSNGGMPVDAMPVTLPPHGRRQITVAGEFAHPTNIGYIIFDSSSDTIQGYTKFFIDGAYRAAIPAVKELNTGNIYVPHIASDAEWWTGISLVNTTSVTKELTITFNDGRSRPIILNANEHKAFDIASLFDNQPQPDLRSAVITNASGVVGLELFGRTNNKQLDGILLTDRTAATLYYPHVAGGEWWTGIVAYNTSALPCEITITPYNVEGGPVTPLSSSIPENGRYFGTAAALGLSDQAAWFRIDSACPLSGFELFGTVDGNQLAPYAGRGGAGAKTGVFAKIEKLGGWTGIAFVNTEPDAASVTLTAYKDNGELVATQVLPPVGGHAKVVSLAQVIFSQDISDATYIAYSSDKDVVGFQLNSSADWLMLDGLPALGGAPIDPH